MPAAPATENISPISAPVKPSAWAFCSTVIENMPSAALVPITTRVISHSGRLARSACQPSAIRLPSRSGAAGLWGSLSVDTAARLASATTAATQRLADGVGSISRMPASAGPKSWNAWPIEAKTDTADPSLLAGIAIFSATVWAL